MLTHKAIVKNESIENVFSRVNNFASNFYKNEFGAEVFILKLWVERRRTPDYLLLSYTNREKWIHKAISIDSYSEIFFKQIQEDVEVLVKMYLSSPFQTTSINNYRRMTKKDAELAWVDFVLDIFRVANVDNYEEIKGSLLSDEVVKERSRIANSFKHSTNRSFINLAIVTIAIMLILWILSKII